MPERSGGQVLAESLASHGMDVAFGIPGTHTLGLHAHLPQAGVRTVTTRHEQGAGYAADGYARVSGRPALCVTTSGPAALNAAAAVGQAYSDSIPILLVTPGMPLRHPGRGNGELHETKDQQAVFDAIAAYSHRVGSVSEIPAAVATAIAAMTGGRPRPVHLEVPLDLLDETADVTPVPRVPVASPVPDAALIRSAAAYLASASRPGIIAGGGARRAASSLRDLAEKIDAPVVTSANGKGTLPEDHPLALGAGLHHPSVAAWVAECDAVLAVGTELAPADLWNGPLTVPDCLIRVDIDPAQLVSNATPGTALHGDAAAVLDQLREELNQLQSEREPTDPTNHRAAHWRTRIHAEAQKEGAPWQWILDGLAAAQGRGGVVIGDSTMACYYGALSNLPRYSPGSFLYPTGFGTLGYALPAAIGAKIAQPHAPVTALMGDGGLMFTLGELATAAQLQLPLPVLIVDDGGYGEIRREMSDRGDPVHAVDLPSPDFLGLARSLGCHAARAEDVPTLAEAVSQAFTADRPTLLHLPEASLPGSNPAGGA